MSIWYQPDDEDIDIDFSEQEVDIYVHSDDQGAVYISIPFERIWDIQEKIEIAARLKDEDHP